MSEATYWGERETEGVARMEKAIEGMTPNEVYGYCRKLEADREYQKRHHAKGAFAASMLSLDQLVDSFEDPSKIQVFTDHGTGGDKVLRTDADNAIAQALSCLTPELRAFAEDVLEGKSWEDLAIPKRTFNWRLKKVENFFIEHCPPPQKPSLKT